MHTDGFRVHSGGSAMYRIKKWVQSRTVLVIFFWLLGSFLGIFSAYGILCSCDFLIVKHLFHFSSVLPALIISVFSVAAAYALLRFRKLLLCFLFVRAYLYGFSFCYLHITGGIMYRSVIIFPHCISSIIILLLCLSTARFHFTIRRKVF